MLQINSLWQKYHAGFPYGAISNALLSPILRFRKHEPKSCVPVALPQSRLAICEDLNRFVPVVTKDSKHVFIYESADLASPVIKEIGRLREHTFRLVGEGSGFSEDIDKFDAYYKHIVLWDDDVQEIIGAYRLANTREVVKERGIAGLYCSSLFNFTDEASVYVNQGVELGRSFIQTRYQGSRSLDYLWQGVGAAILQIPDCHYLFGAVSISAHYEKSAMANIVAHYQHYYGSYDPVVSAKKPFTGLAYCDYFDFFDGANKQVDFRLLTQLLASKNLIVPSLYKHYTDLCDDQGVRFEAFSTDPKFGDCLDAFVVVDMTKIKARKRSRYFMRGVDSC